MMRVGIFKDYGPHSNEIDEYEFPKATGFFLKPTDSTVMIVTARHVVGCETSAEKMTVYSFVPADPIPMRRISLFVPRERALVHATDTLADVAIFPVSGMYRTNRSAFDKFRCWFSLEEIATKQEFDALRKGDTLFYVGAYPDSIDSARNYYWHARAVVRFVLPEPIPLKDSLNACTVSGQVLLTTTGKRGVSGSPIMRLTENGSIQLVGIMSGYAFPEIGIGKREKVWFFTPAYKILEILAANPSAE
jgi:hypothetical protein